MLSLQRNGSRSIWMWRRNWARITPFFNYSPDIRKAIYTTNSVESLNRSLRKIIKTRDGFPNEEAALKLLFLALRQVAKKWTMPIHGTLDRWVGLLKGGGVGGKLLI